MGGHGSGRKNRTTEIINSMKGQSFEPKNPIATEMYLPNLSGDHSRGRVLTTPTTDFEIANKKYVDDASTAPGGNDTEVQFNDGGTAFGGDAGLTYNKTTDVLTTVGGHRVTWTSDIVPLYAESTDTTTGIGFSNPSFSAAINFIIEGTNRYRMTNTALAGIGTGGFWIRTIAGAVSAPEYAFNNDKNTGMFKAGPDSLGFSAGGVEFLRFIETTQDITVFNEGGLDIDFRVESDTDTHAFFLQGSDGFIGIGTSSPICHLDIDGGFAANLTSQTGAYTATTSDHTILCGSGNETFTVTLPAASGVSGIIYNIKNIGTGTITVDGNSSETIDGATTQVISTQYDSITIQCDGSNWHII